MLLLQRPDHSSFRHFIYYDFVNALMQIMIGIPQRVCHGCGIRSEMRRGQVQSIDEKTILLHTPPLPLS
jgi:hypothetical protein